MNNGQLLGLHLNIAKCEFIQKSNKVCSSALLAYFNKKDLHGQCNAAGFTKTARFRDGQKTGEMLFGYIQGS